VDVKADSTLKLVSARKFDSIWMITNRLTKSARFIPINTKYRAEKYAQIYIAHVLCLHGVLKMIISDRGSQFITHFWEQLHVSLGTRLIHSSAYHPQTDDQIEGVNQILEDMLRACVIEYPDSWDKNLPWVEFSYNNMYQESLKMAPFKALYGRQCRTLLNWIEPGEKAIFGPDIVDEAEATVHHIQDN
jgi:transposase InsO family protein